MPKKTTTVRAETRHITATLLSATTAEIHKGRHWYDNAHAHAQALSTAYHVTLRQAAAIIAVLSPRNEWSRNLDDAENLIAAHHNGDDPDNVSVCTFNRNKQKALQVLTTTDPDDIMDIVYGKAGRKLAAFYTCIVDPTTTDVVVIDGHAYSVWRGVRHTLATVPSITPKLYTTISRAYTIVAKRSADLIGHALTPAQVQAITWTTYRNTHGLGKETTA